MAGVRFTVIGEAQPGGSKSAFVVQPKEGGPPRAVVTDANKKVKPWQSEIKFAAADAFNGRPLMNGPLAVTFKFFRPRPKGHYGSGRNAGVVKLSAPSAPDTRPDVLKLARAVEDACTGILWRDDAQIVAESLSKEWGEPARCEIEVDELP